MLQRTTRKRARPTALLLCSALAAAAMIALAGPASAHHRGDRHPGRHHPRKHRFGAEHGPAGSVASFDRETGKLVIDLAGGDTVAGLVTEDTRLEFSGRGGCGHHGWPGDHARRHLHGWDHHGWSHRSDSAGSEDLVPGAEVDRAILIVADGKATFLEVELAKQREPTPQRRHAS